LRVLCVLAVAAQVKPRLHEVAALREADGVEKTQADICLVVVGHIPGIGEGYKRTAVPSDLWKAEGRKTLDPQFLGPVGVEIGAAARIYLAVVVGREMIEQAR